MEPLDFGIDAAKHKLDLATTAKHLGVFENNPKGLCVDPEMKRRIQTHLKALRKELAWLDGRIAEHIQEHEPLREEAKVLQEVKAVGPQTASVLLGHLPLNRRPVAALAGLAPYARDSGKRQRPRSVFAGRGKARKLLSMCAVTCSRHNPVPEEVYERLIGNGKKPMVALIAVAWKLLTHLNSRMARHLGDEAVLVDPRRPAAMA